MEVRNHLTWEKGSHRPICSVSRQRTHSGGRALAVVPPSPVMRHSSDPQLSPSAANNPPAHPAHPSHSAHSSPAHRPGFQPRSSDPAGGFCDLGPCPAGPPKPPAKSYVERLRVEEGRRGGREDGEGPFSAPQVETTSSFRPSRWGRTLLVPERRRRWRLTALFSAAQVRVAAAAGGEQTSGDVGAEEGQRAAGGGGRQNGGEAHHPGGLHGAHAAAAAAGPRPPMMMTADLFCTVWAGGADPGRDLGDSEDDGRDLRAGASDAAARAPAETGPAGAVGAGPPPRVSAPRPPRTPPPLNALSVVAGSTPCPS